MAGEYDLRTNKIVLSGKIRKRDRLESELRDIDEEISALNKSIANQVKEVEGKG